MKQFFAVTVIVALLAVVSSTSFEVAPVPFSFRALKPQPVWPCQNGTGWSCRDCNTLQYCDNNNFEYKITCGVQFPGQDYCNPDTASCTNNRDVCQEIETEMVCPSAGLLPDITDCTKYVSCSGQGQIGISYNCMFNSVYDHNQKRCRTNGDCFNVNEDCQGQFKAIAYKPDQRYFVICRGAQNPMLKDCGKNLVFNSTLMSCEFQCKIEGHFADPSDPSSFYICAYNGEVLVRHHAQCVAGTVFNENTGNCVNGPPA